MVLSQTYFSTGCSRERQSGGGLNHLHAASETQSYLMHRVMNSCASEPERCPLLPAFQQTELAQLPHKLLMK